MDPLICDFPCRDPAPFVLYVHVSVKRVKRVSEREHACAHGVCAPDSLCLLDGIYAAGSMFVLFAGSVMIPSRSDGIRSHDMTEEINKAPSWHPLDLD